MPQLYDSHKYLEKKEMVGMQIYGVSISPPNLKYNFQSIVQRS